MGRRPKLQSAMVDDFSCLTSNGSIEPCQGSTHSARIRIPPQYLAQTPSYISWKPLDRAICWLSDHPAVAPQRCLRFKVLFGLSPPHQKLWRNIQLSHHSRQPSNRAFNRLNEYRSTYPQCRVIAVQDRDGDITRNLLKLWNLLAET